MFKELLDEIEDIAEKRNHCIHSALESKKGKIIQRNNRRSISKEIKSSELYDLANDIFDLQVGLSRIEFRLKRLFFG